MKKFTQLSLICSFMLLATTVNAQTPNWQWASSGTGIGGEGIANIQTDAAGNIYSAGAFAGTSLTLGTFTITHASINNGGTYGDLFISKQDAAGNYLWVKTASAIDTITATATLGGFSVDSSGNIYVQFVFGAQNANSAVIFDNDTLFPTAGAGAYQCIIKFDTNGITQWSKVLHRNNGVSSGFSRKSVIDNTGNYLLMGSFGVTDTSISFDATTLMNPHIGSPAEPWIIKFDPSGVAQWAITAGGPGLDNPSDIDADNNGNFYITGGFSSDTMYFDATTYLINANGGGVAFPEDYFYAKYNSNGIPVWAKSIEYGVTSGLIIPQSFATLNQSGEYYITGMYKQDSLTVGSTILTSPGMFITKTDANGTPLWAHLYGDSIKVGNIFDMQSDAAGNLIVMAQFSEDSLLICGTMLHNAGPGSAVADVALAKLDGAGTPLWALSYGGDGTEAGRLAVTPAGIIHLSGSFKSQQLIFGNDTLFNSDFPNNDIYSTSADGFSGIENLHYQNNGLMLYPNPATSTLNIRISKSSSLCTEVSILNVLGETVFKNCISNSTHATIDVSNLKSGIYVLMIENEKGIVTKKFVKE